MTTLKQNAGYINVSKTDFDINITPGSVNNAYDLNVEEIVNAFWGSENKNNDIQDMGQNKAARPESKHIEQYSEDVDDIEFETDQGSDTFGSKHLQYEDNAKQYKDQNEATDTCKMDLDENEEEHEFEDDSMALPTSYQTTDGRNEQYVNDNEQRNLNGRNCCCC